MLCGSIEKAGLGVRALLLVSRKSIQPLQGAQCSLWTFQVQPFIMKVFSFVRYFFCIS